MRPYRTTVILRFFPYPPPRGGGHTVVDTDDGGAVAAIVARNDGDVYSVNMASTGIPVLWPSSDEPTRELIVAQKRSQRSSRYPIYIVRPAKPAVVRETREYVAFLAPFGWYFRAQALRGRTNSLGERGRKITLTEYCPGIEE